MTKYLLVTTITTDDPLAVLALFRTQHRTGAFTIHLSQGGLSRIEWTETVRGGASSSPPRHPIDADPLPVGVSAK
jgi:hypothetical protein